MEIRNPRIGLLAPARRIWGWLSWDTGATIVALFFGRLVGVPSDLHQEVVTLTFTARPADYNARRRRSPKRHGFPPLYRSGSIPTSATIRTWCWRRAAALEHRPGQSRCDGLGRLVGEDGETEFAEGRRLL